MNFPDYASHADEVRQRATQAVALQAERAPILGVDPRLLLVFEVTGPIPAEDFVRSDLSVVDSSDRTVVVAFADDPQLGGFLERLNRYGEGPVGEMKGAPHQGFFDAITSVRPYGPEDRLTDRLAAELEGLSDDMPVIVDAELWHPGDEATMTTWLSNLEEAITEAEGEVLDRYSNASAGVAIVRGRLPAHAVRELAQIDLIATLDRQPEPDIEVGRALAIDIDALPSVPAPLPNAPLVGLIDSGVRSAHPLLAGSVRDTVSLTEGLADGSDHHGHGTAIASLLLHGPVEQLLASGVAGPPLCRILSVRVLDDDNQFPDATTWAKEIERAIRYCAAQGARIINLSVGDGDTPFSGPRSTPVAAIIDQLIQELELIVVLPVGNVMPVQYGPPDPGFVTRYPADLLNHPQTMMLDPAPAALALTVGALIGVSGPVPLSRRTLGQVGWPAPISRRGPGIERSVKPELSARGGTQALDLDSNALVHDENLMLVAADGTERTGVVLSGHIGTSFAVPQVARVAAAIWQQYPEMSANLIRALVLQATSTDLPTFLELGAGVGDATRAEQARCLTGYGEVRLDGAVFSNDHRAVLYAEDEIPLDGVHLYEIPIPSSFFESGGRREITVSLCYDPPTRARRLDYTASRMKFELVRGVDPEEVVSLFLAAAEEEGEEDDARPEDHDEVEPSEPTPEGRTRLSDLTARERPRLEPSTRSRSAGANQLGRRTFSRVLDKEHGTSFLLVVQSINRWAPAGSRQAYAVAVALRRTEEHGDIYAELEAELRLRAEAQARLHAEART